MQKTISLAMLLLMVNCSPRLNTESQRPDLPKKHTPGISFQINKISKILKDADLENISINGNILTYQDYSSEKQKQIMEATLNGEDVKFRKVKNHEELLTEMERNSLIKELEGFKSANISSLDYHDYSVKYCGEKIVMTKWTRKVGVDHGLIELRKYALEETRNGVFYFCNFFVLTRNEYPKHLEFINVNSSIEDLEIKIDGKEIRVVGDFYTAAKGFDNKFYASLKEQFLAAIENCR